MLLRVTGQPSSVVRESIIVMYWERVGEGEMNVEGNAEEEEERKRETWRCVGQKVVRGMLWNA